jgi:hypothetical protein
MSLRSMKRIAVLGLAAFHIAGAHAQPRERVNGAVPAK